MVCYSMVDILQGEYFLMNNLNQSYTAIEKMPLYEYDLFIHMKVEEIKEQNKNVEG